MTDCYHDDRPGMMRVHVAGERAYLASLRYSRDVMRRHCKVHTGSTGPNVKAELGWWMAQKGLIDAHGNLRDGFPGVAA